MSSHRIRGAATVVATLVLLVVVTAGCGRRGLRDAPAADGGAAGQAAATAERTAAATETTGPALTTDATEPPAGTEPPAATTPPVASPQPTPAPLVAPDLTAIERLLADLDAALGADATADSEEGSAP
jgi:hypothetical protein